MQQFTVPQFIDVEDKIIGPITTRQFLIMLFGFLLMGICYKAFDFSLFVTSAVLIFCVTGIIAFLKINGMAMHYFILNFMQTSRRPRLRIWDNSLEAHDILYEVKETVKKGGPEGPQQKLFNTSRLAELSLIVDTQGAYEGEDKKDGETEKDKNKIELAV